MNKKDLKPSSKLKLRASAAVNAAHQPKPIAAKRATAKNPAVQKPAKAVVSKPPASAKKLKKPKVVRDSFTMPKLEYAQIDVLKTVCMTAGVAVKKSELLRAGLIALAKLKPAQLKAAVQALDGVKTGRPPADHVSEPQVSVTNAKKKR